MRNFSVSRSFLFLLLLLPLAAGATYRADYFDIKKKPQIKFDQKKKTWTLTNGEIERVIGYDTKVGSLKTLRFRNLKNKSELVSTLGSEAEISFVAPLRETPQLLTGWKATQKKPADNWNSTTFEDKDWTQTDYKDPKTDGETWYRVQIPKDRMRPDRAYALVLIEPFIDGGEVYVDGEKVSGAESMLRGSNQFDLSSGSHVIAIHNKNLQASLPEARFVGIAEQGTSPTNLDLKQNWRYMIHTVNVGQDNSLILSITLSGEKQFQGFELEVNYQIHAGGEPTMAKWIYLVSHRPTRFLVDKVIYERWKPSFIPAKEKSLRYTSAHSAGLANLNSGKRQGVMTTVLSRSSSAFTSGEEIIAQASPGLLVKPDIRTELPHSLLCPYTGSEQTGEWLYQLYLGQYVVKGKPGALPLTYLLTGFHEKPNTAQENEAQIPVAAELGIQTFVVGKGWQTTLTGERGGYGDWVTDRVAYPDGLSMFSLKVREAKLNFGLWLSPNHVSRDSKAVADHPDWLIKRADGTKLEDNNATIEDYPYSHSAYPAMCLPSGWMSSFSLSMAAFLRELSATTLITEGNPFEDVCLDPTHEHPLLHALSAQEEQWKLFTEKMHGVSDSMVIIGEGLDNGTDLAGVEGSDRNALAPAFTRIERFNVSSLERTPEIINPLASVVDRFVAGWFLSGAMPCLTGDLTNIAPSDRIELKKWLALYLEVRPWLAYSHSLSGNDIPSATLSLRPVLKGRYGYLALETVLRSRTQKADPIEINASDYFVKLDMSRLELVSVKTGKPIPFTKKENGFVLSNYLSKETSLSDWDLIEIRIREKVLRVPVPPLTQGGG